MNSEFGKKTIPHADLLFTYAWLITGENRKAEKILSQTFAKAFWFWKHLSEETDTKIWLIRIMLNIFRNSPEYNKPEDDLLFQNKTIDLSSSNIQELQKELDYQKAKHLNQLISSLPLRLKEVIIFTDILKFKYELTADLIEVPVDAIRKRLFDARKVISFKWLQQYPGLSSAENINIGLTDKLSIINFIDKNEDEEINDKTTNLLKQEIESQYFIKNTIEQNIFLHQVRETVKLGLIKKYAAHQTNERRIETSSERRGIVTFITIVMILLITIVIIFFRPSQENPAEYASRQVGEDNILVQLKNSYSLYIAGKYDSNMISGNEMMIKSFLSTAEFSEEIVLPGFSGWKIKKVFLSAYKNVNLRNLIYENDAGKSLYLFQIPLKLIDDNQLLQLTPGLMNYIETNNCYSSRNGTTLYLLKKTERHIFGIVVENPKKALIFEICSNSSNSIF